MLCVMLALPVKTCKAMCAAAFGSNLELTLHNQIYAQHHECMQ